MRILHILDHSIPLQSGYTFRTRNIIAEQRALGWHTAHVTGSKQGPADVEEEIDGLTFYRTTPNGGPLTRLPLLDQWDVVSTLSRRIVEVAAQECPDILHAHSPALNGLAALKAGRQLGLPVVYECRAFWEDAAVDHGTSREGGPRYRATRALESYVFRHADAVTTICEGLREDIVGRGLSADNITVIPNAVNVDSFNYGAAPDAALQRELGLEGKTVLGFIGSFYAYEGLPLLLESMPALVAANPDTRLLLVGGGPQEATVKARIQALGLTDAVILTGRVPHSDVQAYYNLVDVLVYPRLPMRLTELVTPLKPLEAMAQGRLVVASDVGGHRELIRDGETGCLFRAGDASALANAVSDLLQRPDDWQAMREAGRQFVESERTWAASVGRYRALYDGLLRPRQAQSA
ncbi:TIGR04063 family PEP-CTERM/XrtA system glycosyltransferase [Chromatocurvus halotolerans]|uniref:PEP-CTERM/exosortase A-associated glycosyltransferase n=1 Tax=Chromatocurvus halotolerans TaxID=1132028 RepID=A0A4R2KTA8_9GAMM|nr:TIGR04063 family PEP-CTERM/XrtA system glycosyltransferase [Chromatocurvus halotolerans]TCO74316.1 PEP-CTERM/exosortase A-associated glycosyltransferase [Chromatocurvus halotolerans]